MSEELAPRSMAEVCKKQREEIARVKVIAARNIGRALEAEAARDKALADVERLRKALQEIETVPVSSSGRDYYWTGREIAKAALKETSGEQE